MIEILFTESAAGGLKYARSYGKGEYKSKAMHFAVANNASQLTEAELEAHRKDIEEKERIKWEKAVPMDISSKDVIALPFGLAMGDISEDYPSEKRFEYFRQLLSIYPDFTKPGQMEKFFGKMQQSLERVLEAIKANQPVRLWYSDNPDEICGLYHLVYLIEKINPDCEIYTVKLPSLYTREDGTIVLYNGWGGVPPEEWHLHFKTEKMTKSFKTMCLSNWNRLKDHNALVRALLNGIVHSFPEDIYDSFIIKEINEMGTQFRQAVVIGKVLGKYQLCTGDAFIAQRMEKMIENGTLEIVTSAEAGRPLYHRLLKKKNT